MKFPPLPFKPEQLSAKVKRYAEMAESLKNPEMLKTLFSCIDLTTLNPTDTVSSVAAFTGKVNSFELEFNGLPNVAAICTYPNMTSVVRENLAVENVRIAAVAGGFPSSMTFREMKVEEARLAVIHGADEIDMVLPLWAFLEGNAGYCIDEIKAVKKAVGEAHLKVILESGVLSDIEKIWQASILSLEAGADFIKTSTGKMPVSATPEAAIVMCHAIRFWHETTGISAGFKPAGGISKTGEALLYAAIVKEIPGEKWLDNTLFRIGASRLANHLLSEILGKETAHF